MTFESQSLNQFRSENSVHTLQGYSPDVAFRWFLGETVSPLTGAQKVSKKVASKSKDF